MDIYLLRSTTTGRYLGPTEWLDSPAGASTFTPEVAANPPGEFLEWVKFCECPL